MRMNEKTTLKLSRVLSTNASGHEVLNYVNITSVNPEVEDADMLAIGQALGDLQSLPLHAVGRIDSSDLAE